MAAFAADPQVDPCVTRLQAFFAAVRARGDIMDMVEMGALLRHGEKSPLECLIDFSVVLSSRPLSNTAIA